jgi:hypothetical protein
MTLSSRQSDSLQRNRYREVKENAEERRLPIFRV